MFIDRWVFRSARTAANSLRVRMDRRVDVQFGIVCMAVP
jgi:hypothetical protein